MRLPIGRVYRAFAALDRFSDAQCEWYVRKAIRNHIPSMLLMALIAPITAIIVGIVIVVVEVVIAKTASGVSIPGFIQRHEWLGYVLIAVAVILPILSGLVAGLMVRDMWLRASIIAELARSTCPKCDYQLLGLPVHAGVVRCPECGLDTKLDVEVPAAELGRSVSNAGR